MLRRPTLRANISRPHAPQPVIFDYPHYPQSPSTITHNPHFHRQFRDPSPRHSATQLPHQPPHPPTAAARPTPPSSRKIIASRSSSQFFKARLTVSINRMSSKPIPEGLVRVHDYGIGEKLAQGEFSSIRLAYNLQTKNRCAVKVISKSKLPQSRLGQKIIFNETVLAALVDHPSLIEILDICDSDTHIYQFMRLAEHGNLLEKLRKTPLEISIVIRLIDQLFAGVEYLHSLGICHRDINLENLLLTNHGGLKMCGFGLSSISMAGQIKSYGTPSYLYWAPESWKTPVYNGFQADMWSCGVVVYALFSRRFPYPKVTPEFDFSDKVDYSLIPKDFQGLISSLLSMDPAARPTASQCRADPCLRSTQPLRAKLPLSSLKLDKSVVESNWTLCSKLSQVIGVPVDALNAKMCSDEMNWEKALLILLRRRMDGRSAELARKVDGRPGFFAAPEAAKMAVVEKIHIFPAPSSVVWAAMHNYAVRIQCTVAVPLSSSPSIVLHSKKGEMKVTYHCSDDASTGQCSVMLCANNESLEMATAIMKYLQNHFAKKAELPSA